MAALFRNEKRRFRPVNRTGIMAGAITAAFVGTLALSSYGGEPPKGKTVAGLPAAEVQALSERFVQEVWPMLAKNCLSCHAQKNASQFLLPKDPKAAFLVLLAEGHFDEDNQSSVVHRVTTTDQKLVMPPPAMGELPRPEVAKVEKLAEDIATRRASNNAAKPDEVFPSYLELPYTGKKHTGGLDNTFVTFRQLRGKIKTIFNDDWKREDQDLFVENVHLFGGADFIKRFDETAKAAPTFLTGVDLMGRDVASRAYLTRSGPFAGFSELPSPVGMKAPSKPMQDAINTLYRRMLYRDATPTEQRQAFAFLQKVSKQDKALQATAPQDVRFALTVTDEQGQQVAEDVTIRVTNDEHAVRQEFVDQSKEVDDGKNRTATRWLYDAFTFAPNDPGQKLTITNAGTHGNVSIASITLRGPLPATTEKTLPVSDPSVQSEGAWRISQENGLTSYEDNNENKGSSYITFPINVAQPGTYEVAVTWRRFGAPAPGRRGGGRRRGPAQGAENVLVEVASRDKESILAVPAAPDVPPPGEAHFTIDQTIDNRPYADLKTAFRFGPDDGVEVRNDGTRKRVVADAVRLLPPVPQLNEEDQSLVLKASEAVGRDKWTKFAAIAFRAYNTIGPDIYQDTDAQGKKEGIGLLFKPSVAQREGWKSTQFYRVGVIYPGQVDNETNVPIVVHAKASSPIVQVVHPYHAHVGAAITVDASATYNLQHSKLAFRWTQIGGPRVPIKDPAVPTLEFVAPPMSSQQAAWEGLCRALMEHPDFLFTRPRSLATTTDPKTRRRLQLVKIAQDLLSRTPTPEEIAEVDAGKPLGALVDRYLASKEFQDFYFHRVRLYLESHGTPEQDEPARLWTYITLNNRPFQEILTADYQVDTEWKKQSRPAYFGKTGVLTMKGFIEGKPGLPHFNYPAQVLEKFMGYVFEVPDSVLQTRDGITASATTDPSSVCYTCHKVLTPLAYQRLHWDDLGNYRAHDETGMMMDNTDQGMVASYPYKGKGIEAFALQAQHKERFIRTILQTHFVWYFGRELRYETDERTLYRRLWDIAEKNKYAIRPIIRAIVLSPEYLNGSLLPTTKPKTPDKSARLAKLAQFHSKAGVRF